MQGVFLEGLINVRIAFFPAEEKADYIASGIGVSRGIHYLFADQQSVLCR